MDKVNRSKLDTYEHISHVRYFLAKFITTFIEILNKESNEQTRNFLSSIIIELLNRQETHDKSKLIDPELSSYAKIVPKLADVKYGTDEYKKILNEMKPAIDHHYASNRHHPEHFKNGVNDMNIIDVIEMLCDWKASSLRTKQGSIIESLAHNYKRFNISDILYRILLHSLAIFEPNYYCLIGNRYNNENYILLTIGSEDKASLDLVSYSYLTIKNASIFNHDLQCKSITQNTLDFLKNK